MLIQTAILGTVYILGIECGLIGSGIALDQVINLTNLDDYDKSVKLMFAGGLISTFFWVC